MTTIDPWRTDPRWFDRTEIRSDNLRMHERVKRASGDNLMMRRLILRTHGRETLHNFILQAHGRPNRY